MFSGMAPVRNIRFPQALPFGVFVEGGCVVSSLVCPRNWLTKFDVEVIPIMSRLLHHMMV